MKPAHLDCDRESLARVRKMYLIADGGRIRTIHAINDVGFYLTVWLYRRFPTTGIFFFSQIYVNRSFGQLIISHLWLSLSFQFTRSALGVHFSDNRMRGFLSIDIDVSELQVNQCTLPYSIDYRHGRPNTRIHNDDKIFNQIEAFHGSHKCHLDSMTVCVHFIL